MSYYILPKINDENIEIQSTDSSTNVCHLYISHSLFNYCKQSINEIEHSVKIITAVNTETYVTQCSTNKAELLLNNYQNIYSIVNPCEFIFSKVPGSKYSVSKLKPTTSLFYDFLEIITTLDIFEQFKHISSIKSLHITNNYNDINDCFEMIREDFNDQIISFNKVSDENIKLIHDEKFNFLFFETTNNNLNDYFIMLMEYVGIILKNIEIGGTCIIKINQTFHKPVIDILYFLSSLFEKVYILKPNTSNITSFDKYIICKEFYKNKINKINLKNMKMNYYRIIVFLKKLENRNILSVINIDLPYYFITKINDINNIIGQQQLEALNLIINTLKNKNKDDKIELLQKSNIQKSVAWCEKYKIPCNKFFEKTNIFLPIIKEEKNQKEESSTTSALTENL
jgi:23S rRNA U2552 (ribose-2'-O)-methylase RlmE/FtsJ